MPTKEILILQLRLVEAQMMVLQYQHKELAAHLAAEQQAEHAVAGEASQEPVML